MKKNCCYRCDIVKVIVPHDSDHIHFRSLASQLHVERIEEHFVLYFLIFNVCYMYFLISCRDLSLKERECITCSDGGKWVPFKGLSAGNGPRQVCCSLRDRSKVLHQGIPEVVDRSAGGSLRFEKGSELDVPWQRRREG